MSEDVTYIMEKCAHGALFRSFFQISANTCKYFGKYAHVFPQINSAWLEKAMFSPCQGLKRVRTMDVLAHWVRPWVCHSRGRGKIYALPQKTLGLVSCILFLLAFLSFDRK